MYIITMTLGSKLPAFSASRQLTSDDAAADGRRGDVVSKHYSGVRAQRRKAIMRVIPQREPGGELYVRPGTSALLSDSFHNIVQLAKIWGGRITLASPPLRILGGGRVPPGVYAYAYISRTFIYMYFHHAS